MPNTRVTGTEQKPEDESISFVLPGNESELRQMIAALPGMLWTANPRGMFDFISPQWRELTGQPLTRLLGMGWLDVILADDREAVREQWKIAADNPAPLILEFRLCTREGHSRWFSMRGTPIFDELKCIDRWFGLCVDIDDFKLTQQNLRVTERRYDVLFDNKTNGAVQLQMIYDAQGLAIDARVVRVNQTYTSIIGLSKEYVEGRLLTELFPDIRGFDIDYIALYGKMASNAGEANFETDFHAAEKWLGVYAYSAFPGEIIAIFSDISAQKKPSNHYVTAKSTSGLLSTIWRKD